MVKCTKRQIRQLKTALHWKMPEAQRQRIQMILLRESRMAQPAIADAMGVSLSTVNRAHPAEGLGHGGVEVGDELLDPGLQHVLAGEVAAADELSRQNGKPDFDLIQPRRVLGREVENDSMVFLAQKRFAGCLGRKDPGLALDAEVAVEGTMLRNEANNRLGEMDVEVVADDIPPCVGCGAAQQIVEETRKILLGAGIADHSADLAGGDIESSDQGLRAVAAILELAPLDLAGLHRQSRRGALQGLNAGHLVDRDRAMAVVGTGCGLVNLADVSALGVKGRIGFRRQPMTKAMRFEVGLFFKNRPTERCEMLGTRPRRIASPAISRWLQWLIGRSLSDGLSQVIAITAQICSGVYVAGAPERGASQSRSGTDCPSGASRQRLRQSRTVFAHTSSPRALSRTPMLSAACKIMRARNANCCEVEWARTSASSASACAGKTITRSSVSQGIAFFLPNPRFVMPHNRRFDSRVMLPQAALIRRIFIPPH